MSIQTSYPFDRAVGYPGGLADAGPHRVKSVLAAAALVAGALVMRGATAAKGYALTAPDAADADGIVTARATAATAETLTGVALNGAVGGNRMFPARNITITASSHANYDLTTWIVRGLDENGLPQEELFVMPDGGNTTLVGKKFFSMVSEIYIPAQSGTGGSTTIGFGSILGPLTPAYVHGLAVYDASREPGAYAVNDAIPVVERGPVYVTSETSYSDGGEVYVRLVVSGNEVLGAFRATPDSNDCALLAGARFRRSGSAGVAVIDLNP